MLCWTTTKSISVLQKAPKPYFWGPAIAAQGTSEVVLGPLQPPIKQYVHHSHSIWTSKHSPAHSLLLQLLFFHLFLTQKGFADSPYEEWCRKTSPKTKALSHMHCNPKMHNFTVSQEDTTGTKQLEQLTQDFSPNTLLSVCGSYTQTCITPVE